MIHYWIVTKLLYKIVEEFIILLKTALKENTMFAVRARNFHINQKKEKYLNHWIIIDLDFNSNI